jgi:hypothetical protein
MCEFFHLRKGERRHDNDELGRLAIDWLIVIDIK